VARHFLRLKLALLASVFRGQDWQRIIGLVVGVVFAVPAGLGVFALLWLAGRRTEIGGDLVVLVFAVVALVWTVGPLLLFGLDETLDPARLRLLPLTRRQMVTGLLTAGAIGVGPLATLVAFAGAVPGLAPAGPGALVVVAAVPAQLALCLLGSRVLTTALSSRLRTRRGRDVSAMLGILMVLMLAGLGQLPGLFVRLVERTEDPAEVLASVAGVVGLLPVGWAGRAVDAAAGGRPVAGTGWLLLTFGLLAGLAWWWSRLLEGALLSVPDRATPAGDHGLFPSWLGFLPRTHLGAAIAREVRYQLRVPQLRVQWLLYPVLGGFLLVGALAAGVRDPRVVLTAAGLGALVGFSALNVFGADGRAVWVLVSAGGPRRADLVGKTAAPALLGLPIVGVVALGLAGLTGGWLYVPLAVLAGVGVVATAFGVGLVTSVLAPYPIPDSPVNMWSGSTGMGCATMLLQLLALMVSGLLLLPLSVAALLAVLRAPHLLPLVAVLLAPYGLGVWWAGVVLADRLLADRAPELIASLTPR
jgi:ABC-2 type transport system permease protein